MRIRGSYAYSECQRGRQKGSCASNFGRQSAESFLSSTTDVNNEETEKRAIEEMNNMFRFGGLDSLYSTRSCVSKSHNDDDEEENESISPLDRLQKSTVVVVGLGGVGSWAAEALCRSGIGHLVLVDLDDICMSNTNRQMHTSSSTVGKFKIDVLAERFRDINPLCHVTCIHDFVSVENVHDILDQIQNTTQAIMDDRGARRGGITAVLDAIDGSKAKSALLAACVDASLPVVTCGGAAGYLDPTRIVCDDLTRVMDDKLLTSCRTNLRKYHNFPPGLPFPQQEKTKRWNIPAVYSTENLDKTMDPSSSSLSLQSSDSSSSLSECDSSVGSACFVTGTFGFTAAAKIVTGIAENTLKPPRRDRKSVV